MQKALANFASLIFHPLFMPAYGIILLFNVGGYFSFLPSNYQWLVYSIVWVFTLGFPLLMLYLFKKTGKISSYALHNRKERILPMSMVLLSYIAATVLLFRLNAPPLILRYFIGLALVLATISIVSIWWKISAHMAGAGGFVAAAIVFGLFLKLNISPIVIIFFLLSGVIGWSRITLKAHSQSEIAAGFIVGFATIALVASGYIA